VIEKLKAGDRLQQDTPTSLSNRTMPVRSLSGVEVSYFLSFDQHRSTAATIQSMFNATTCHFEGSEKSSICIESAVVCKISLCVRNDNRRQSTV
jgi:hypothetical protein